MRIEKIGNFKVELADNADAIFIRNNKGELLKAETCRPIEGIDLFTETCNKLKKIIKDRKEAGKKV
tara:strand:+ start:3253 stop:3450 length:198 start_codon:yes stop_codon:yes gene_type:complete